MNQSLCDFSKRDISTFCACATCVCTWPLSSCGDWVCNLRGQFLLKIPVFPSLSSSSASAAVEPRHWCLIIFLHLPRCWIGLVVLRVGCYEAFRKGFMRLWGENMWVFSQTLGKISQQSHKTRSCHSSAWAGVTYLSWKCRFFHLFGGFNDFLFMSAE